VAGNRHVNSLSKSAVARYDSPRPLRGKGLWPYRPSVAISLLESRDFEKLGRCRLIARTDEQGWSQCLLSGAGGRRPGLNTKSACDLTRTCNSPERRPTGPAKALVEAVFGSPRRTDGWPFGGGRNSARQLHSVPRRCSSVVLSQVRNWRSARRLGRGSLHRTTKDRIDHNFLAREVPPWTHP
jgi:hypothetical protein